VAKTRSRRYSKNMTLPLAVIAGMAVPAVDLWQNGIQQGDTKRTMNTAAAIFTGYNPESKTWEVAYLKRGLLPVVMGLLVHKYVGGKLGVNRALAGAGVPLIRL